MHCILDFDGWCSITSMKLLQKANLTAVMFVFAGMSNMEGILLILRLIYLLTKARCAGGMLMAFAALDRHATLPVDQQTCKTEPDCNVQPVGRQPVQSDSV